MLDILRELGGEGPTGEVCRRVADRVVTDPAKRDATFSNGKNRAEHEAGWALDYLRRPGMIDGSTYGRPKLTELGWRTHLTTDQARVLRKDVYAQIKAAKESEKAPTPVVTEDPEDAELVVPERTLAETLLSLSPKGFEVLSQHVLRATGLEEVIVTGRSHDGGIDGRGVLRVNPLVSFPVVFQCKKYQGAVGPKEVRDLRGAMSGRGDTGILLTTGSFTHEARKEASRDGVPSIELIDGTRLVEIMERHEIGVRPRVVYDVDDTYFDKFRNL